MAERETCRATKENGDPCRSPFVNESGYCDAHDPDRDPEEMAERGRKGAEVTKERREARAFDVDSLPEIRDAEDVRVWGEAVARAVARGAIGETRGNTLSRLLRQIRGALEAEVGDKIEELRSELAAVEEKVEEPSWKG